MVPSAAYQKHLRVSPLLSSIRHHFVFIDFLTSSRSFEVGIFPEQAISVATRFSELMLRWLRSSQEYVDSFVLLGVHLMSADHTLEHRLAFAAFLGFAIDHTSMVCRQRASIKSAGEVGSPPALKDSVSQVFPQNHLAWLSGPHIFSLSSFSMKT